MNYIFLIGICVILPMVVVWLNTRKEQNETNKKTEVLLKAIEAGMPIDESLLKPKENVKTIKERLLSRLSAACVSLGIGLIGCFGLAILAYQGGADTQTLGILIIAGTIISGIGIALLIVYFVGRKMLAKEIEAEEKSLDNKEK